MVTTANQHNMQLVGSIPQRSVTHYVTTAQLVEHLDWLADCWQVAQFDILNTFNERKEREGGGKVSFFYRRF